VSAAYETVIGLECHVELSTATKMFCGCANSFGAPPNTNVCPVCLGHPGTLPVPNEKAIEYIVRIGLALDSEIAPRSLFHRKNYFYPDMPKNYQISQYDLPVCVGGSLSVEVADGSMTRVGITRVHMEEDTGKTSHAGTTGRIAEATYALVDYNRAGVPLVECVSEPDIRSPEEAGAYLRELRSTLDALEVSDVRMEEGSLRCDANVSVRPAGSPELGTKVEIKNMNSVRSLERAIRYESERQVDALEKGETLVQETRHWNEDQGMTTSMRSKEEAFDYRYFPEPDIPALEPDRAWVSGIRAGLPELPAARRERYETVLELAREQARILSSSRDLAQLFEQVGELLSGVEHRMIANWITQNVVGAANERRMTIAEIRDQSRAIADIIRLVSADEISTIAGKQVLDEVLETGAAVEEIVEEKGLRQVSDEGELGAIVDAVIAENPDPVQQVRGGKDGAIGFLVGQVMKRSGGSADPKLAGRLLRERLTT
jgi:aspartyl-tRNA(Asn)/glutamyl-tRNA(Gln) amidotransferase subunit B